MAGSKIDLANAIRQSVQMYRGLSEFADALEDVGKLEQQKNELTAAIQSLEADKAGKVLELQAAQAKVDEVTNRGREVMTAALAEANRLTAEAKEQAEAIRKANRTRLSTMENKYEEALKARESAAIKAVKEAEEALKEAQELERAAKAETAKLKREYADLQAKKEAIKQQLASVIA